MMLSSSHVADLLNDPSDKADRLSIVPMPDLTRVSERGGTSIDLRLGRWFRTFKQSKNRDFDLWYKANSDAEATTDSASLTSEHYVPFGRPFVLHPGRFVLGVTLEWVTLPRKLSGYVTGKSSLGRHGLIIETASGIHPGFSGCLTLELANVGEIPLSISPGMEICQIFLHEFNPSPESSLGTFSGKRKPSISCPKRDPTFERLRDAYGEP